MEMVSIDSEIELFTALGQGVVQREWVLGGLLRFVMVSAGGFWL